MEYVKNLGNGYKIAKGYANEWEGTYGDVYLSKSAVEESHPGCNVLEGYVVISEATGFIPDECNDWNSTLSKAIADYEKHLNPNVTYGIEITYSWGDYEDGLIGNFQTKEEAFKAMCMLAAKEAYAQNEEFLEENTCSVNFRASEMEVNLHYDFNDTWCYYRIKEHDKAEKNAEKAEKSFMNSVMDVIEDYLKKEGIIFNLVERKKLTANINDAISNHSCDVIAGDFYNFEGELKCNDNGEISVESEALEEYLMEYSME